ncbi:uncharacterized protein LOC115209349, partial [Argonauta hians]
ASCQIEKTSYENKQYNEYWQSRQNSDGVEWYPGSIDYRKNQEYQVPQIEETDDSENLDSSYRTIIEEGPQYLSEYKQENAAQTGIRTSYERQYEPPHYDFRESEYHQRREYPNPNFHQNQQLPVLNRDPYGQIHYGDYFLSGQRVPRHPNLQTYENSERKKFTSDYDEDVQPGPVYDRREYQDNYHGKNPNDRLLEYLRRPDGAALLEKQENYDFSNYQYPNFHRPAYETEYDYQEAHLQIPLGKGYLPYGKDNFFENEDHLQRREDENEPKPHSTNGQYFIHAGRDGLPAPTDKVTDSIEETKRTISPTVIVKNRVDANTLQPDKHYSRKGENGRHQKEEKVHASKPSPLPDSRIIEKKPSPNPPNHNYGRKGRFSKLQDSITKTADISSTTQNVLITRGRHSQSGKGSESSVPRENLVTVPTVEIRFNMFQPDVSNKEEKHDIHDVNHDRNRESAGHNSKFRHIEQENQRNNSQRNTSNRRIDSSRDHGHNYDVRKTINRQREDDYTQRRQKLQSNVKNPVIYKQERPYRSEEEAASQLGGRDRRVGFDLGGGDRRAGFDLGGGDRRAGFDLGGNTNRFSHQTNIDNIDQPYDQSHQRPLIDNSRRPVSNLNVLVRTYDRDTSPLDSSSEYSAVKERKLNRRKQQSSHRNSETRRVPTSRRRQNNNEDQVPGIAQRNTCPSASQCRCCRWSTQQTEKNVQCLQPTFKRVEVDVCIEENNGVCVRTGKKQTLKPSGSEIKMCSKVQISRSCHVCCPSHYPVGNITTCTGILDGIDKTGLRISIAADDGQIEYARLPKNHQPRRRHNTHRNGRNRPKTGHRSRHNSRRRPSRRPLS